MKESSYRSYDELPLFLNAATVAKVLGVSPSSGYELMHEPDFPVLKVNSVYTFSKHQVSTSAKHHVSLHHMTQPEPSTSGLFGKAIETKMKLGA